MGSTVGHLPRTCEKKLILYMNKTIWSIYSAWMLDHLKTGSKPARLDRNHTKYIIPSNEDISPSEGELPTSRTSESPRHSAKCGDICLSPIWGGVRVLANDHHVQPGQRDWTLPVEAMWLWTQFQHAAKWETPIWEAGVLCDSSSATCGEGTVNRSLLAGAGEWTGEYRGFLGREAPLHDTIMVDPSSQTIHNKKQKTWLVNFKCSNPTDKETGIIPLKETGIIPLAVWGYITENVMVSHLGEREQENIEYTSV